MIACLKWAWFQAKVDVVFKILHVLHVHYLTISVNIHAGLYNIIYICPWGILIRVEKSLWFFHREAWSDLYTWEGFVSSIQHFQGFHSSLNLNAHIYSHAQYVLSGAYGPPKAANCTCRVYANEANIDKI